MEGGGKIERAIEEEGEQDEEEYMWMVMTDFRWIPTVSANVSFTHTHIHAHTFFTAT